MAMDIPGGSSEVQRMIMQFFSNENTVARLVLFKDVVNKSKRKGDIPLYQFYTSMLHDEKLIYMVYKSNKVIIDLKPEEKVVLLSGVL